MLVEPEERTGTVAKMRREIESIIRAPNTSPVKLKM